MLGPSNSRTSWRVKSPENEVFRADPRGRLRVALAIPTMHLYEPLGPMLCAILERCGCSARLTRDGDESVTDVDLLLLIGSGSCFPKFRALLRGPQSRTRVVLWQQEPVPPPRVPTSTKFTGRILGQLLTWDRQLNNVPDFTNRQAPARRTWMSYPLRPAISVLRRLYLQGLSRVVGPSAWDLSVGQLHLALSQGDWLRRVAPSWIDDIVCSTPTRCLYLAEQGLRTRFVPLGWHPQWGVNRKGPRDLDVLFLGSLSHRGRMRVVHDVFAELNAAGFRTRIVDRNCYGPDREDLLNRTKVVLNLLNYPWEFPGMRLLMSLGCGAWVVSETCPVTAPYRAGVHFTGAEPHELASVIRYYLTHEAARAACVERARQSLEGELRLETQVGELLSPWLQARRAAA